MRVPDEVRDTVVFIGAPVRGQRGETLISYSGTAFLVSVVLDGLQFNHLVTAKHVAAPLEERGEFIIRVNTRDGQTMLIGSGGHSKWYYHPTDDSTDVAVSPFDLPDRADGMMIPEVMFIGDEQFSHGFGIGDEVFLTGLFAQMAGRSRNLPIVRIGNIAMLPDEKIPVAITPTTPSGLMDAYLIEARSIGGLSGSPAFVRSPMKAMPGLNMPNVKVRPGVPGYEFYFLGLMHGHWDLPPEAMNSPGMVVATPTSRGVNMGIAIVVPAYKILETIYQEELREMREEQAKDAKHGKKRDGAGAQIVEDSAMTKETFEAALRQASRNVKLAEAD